MRTLLTMVAVALGLIIGPVAAQEGQQQPAMHNARPSDPLFQCTQETIGQTACQAGVRCKCYYDAWGSSMQGLPPGYRWDCGLQQGNCMNDVPATTSGTYGNPQPQMPPPTIMVPYQVEKPSGK